MTSTFRRRERVIKLRTYMATPNVGDLYSQSLATWMNVRIECLPHDMPYEDPHLLLVGSLLEHAGPSSIVCGTGFVLGSGDPAASDYHMVRGLLSKERIVAAELASPDLAVGEPGILADQLFPSASERMGVGVVPHYVDQADPMVARWEREGAKIIRAGQDPQSFLGELAQCEAVISTSLHGIVFAHAYGIPAMWVVLSDRVLGDGFKFRDYYSALGSEAARRSGADASLEDLAGLATLPSGIDDMKIRVRLALRGALEQLGEPVPKALKSHRVRTWPRPERASARRSS